MVTLNDVKIEPAEARDILRYLADHHGLAPEEAKPAAFEVERRMIDYKYADKRRQGSPKRPASSATRWAASCSQRRTKEEWELLIAMHRGYYPLVDFQAFRRGGPPPRDRAGPRRPSARQPASDGQGDRAPVDRVSADDARMVRLVGDDASAAAAGQVGAVGLSSSGKGAVFGQVTITPQGGADTGDFTTETTLHATRAPARRHPHADARSSTPAFSGAAKVGDDAIGLREVMFVDRDWRHASGRWFTGAYDEFGIDVQLRADRRRSDRARRRASRGSRSARPARKCICSA